jgi:sodium-dependent phosphate cotransporter
MNLSESKLDKKHFFLFLIAISVFIVLISVLTSSFEKLENGYIKDLISGINSPFFGLAIGVLVTAIVHSSSLITSTIVVLVASQNLSIEDATYMILGANIGTTITSTLLAFGHIANKKEYRRAVAAGTMHDFFNILTVMILFPLEYFFKILSKPAVYITKNFHSSNKFSFFDYTDFISNPILNFLTKTCGLSYLFCIAISFLGLFITIKVISTISKNIFNLKSRTEIFKNDANAFGWGMILTMLLRSSSVTTSIIVPFVATKKIKLDRAFPFVMGANLGTTNTALIVGFASGNPSGLAIALIHFLFNLIGILIFLPILNVRKIPLLLAKKIGLWSYQNRFFAIAYLLLIFFILPLLCYAIF